MESKVTGSGKPIILLHEWLGDHRNWLPMLRYCPTDEFAFHCLDLPGYGMSQDIAKTPSIEAIAELVLNYASERKLEKFALVAHSMSGLVAHHLGVVAPQTLADLIFFCPVPPNGFKATEDGIAAMHSVATRRDALRDAILVRGGEFESDEWVDEKVDLAWSASEPEVKKAHLEMFLAPVHPVPQKSTLRRAKIIGGEVDLPFYQEASLRNEFQPYYGEIEVDGLAKCGHYPMLQDPKLSANVLLECLKTPIFP